VEKAPYQPALLFARSSAFFAAVAFEASLSFSRFPFSLQVSKISSEGNEILRLPHRHCVFLTMRRVVALFYYLSSGDPHCLFMND